MTSARGTSDPYSDSELNILFDALAPPIAHIHIQSKSINGYIYKLETPFLEWGKIQIIIIAWVYRVEEAANNNNHIQFSWIKPVWKLNQFYFLFSLKKRQTTTQTHAFNNKNNCQ